jgi:hypothetical protein
MGPGAVAVFAALACLITTTVHVNGSEVALMDSANSGSVLRCFQSATLSKKTTWSPCDESTWQEPVLCEADGTHQARCVAAVDLRDHRVSRGCMNHKDADFLYMYSSPKEQAGQCRVSRGTVYCFCDNDMCNDHQLIVNHQCFHCGRKGLGLQECATRAGVIHKCLSPYILSLGKKTMGYMYCVKEIDYAKDGAVAR